MSVPPRPPSNRGGPSDRQPAPGRQPSRPAGPALAAGRGPGPRRAQPIRYSAAPVRESRWRRNALIVLGSATVVLGIVGWYRHFTRPPVLPEVPAVEAPGAARAPARSVDARSDRARRPATEPAPSTDPLMLSARELDRALADGPDRAAAAAFADYRGREVTWSGKVIAAAMVNELLRVEVMDDDGVRFIAWCDGPDSLAAGARVTVRGRLESRDRSGFVLEHCDVL